ncbi:MAG: BcpO-related WXXGXW repeat protein [Candidatus Eremiobacteraeota bacterium]|nr:YXWGXW repeat-containing protein [Candidatus Eremiobacteraeota bacterium]NNM91766.1 BcpO-related WXXGXW repeat protein [Candidatus Eremiobacteraeota bacterium]
MKFSRTLFVAIVATLAFFMPRPASAITLSQIISLIAPPAIPSSSYLQPAPPAPNSMWIPGYWNWNGNAYNWVAGRWTYAPSPGLVWTPSYWQATPAGYLYHSGYWGRSVGYYGNLNYGHGYFGQGYDGGKWQGKTFLYNTYVTHVDQHTVHAVYFDRNVYRRSPEQNHQSFAGRMHSANRGHAMQAHHGAPPAKESGRGKPANDHAGKGGKGNSGQSHGGHGHGKPPR